MNANNFSISSKIQEVWIVPGEITASHDGLNSFLWFTLHLKLRIPYTGYEFDILSIEASLRIGKDDVLLSKLNVHPSITVRQHEDTFGQLLKFPLELQAIELVESVRTGDAKFRLDLEFQILQRIQVALGTDKIVRGTDGLLVDRTYLQPIIPMSDWAESILKKLGYGSFRLVQIPLHYKAFDGEYETSIMDEFLEAEKYLKRQDYNKCIAHLRSCLEGLNRNLQKIKKKDPSESKFKWLEKVNAEAFAYTDGLCKSTSAVTSITHHSNSSSDFSKNQAESIYLVTLAVLHYIAPLRKDATEH